jgi:hypothetical protein
MMKACFLAAAVLLTAVPAAEAQYGGYYYGGYYPRSYGIWDGNNIRGPVETRRYDGYPTGATGYRFPNYATREYNALGPDPRYVRSGPPGKCRVVSVQRDGKTKVICRWAR